MPSGGGLLQLVAMGKQDVFLTGNPQITFFKLVYRRHTNFSVESCRMYFDGTPNFGQRITCLVPRQADLLGPLFLHVELPALTDLSGNAVPYVNSIGNALIEEITLEVGEQEIDKQTGEFMELWSQLTVPPGQKDAYDNMVRRSNIYTTPPWTGAQSVIVPLNFWFCRNPGSYLPLLALQYHPIRINIKLRSLADMAYFGTESLVCQPNSGAALQPASIQSIMMWGDYLYLDVEERRRFVSQTHEYLIEQVQYTPPLAIPAATAQISNKMDFNHPLKELIWTVQRDKMTNLHEYFNYSNLAITESSLLGRTDNMLDAKLQFDGQDRFETRTAPYFRLVQPYQRHTNTPVLSFIYVYSFALRPEDAQPSGTVNASRLDTINLLISMNQGTDPVIGNCHSVIYATNYNVFRVIDGFGGLLFKV